MTARLCDRNKRSVQALVDEELHADTPVFRAEGRILTLRPVGDGTHLKLLLGIGPDRFDAIWFGAVRDGVCPVAMGQIIQIAFELDANIFRDKTRLQLRVRHAAVSR